MATLAQLRDEVRQRADMQSSQFVKDDELTGFINRSYSKLYDLLVGAFEDYRITQTTLTISTGNALNLPADFYKLRGVDFSESASTDQWVSLRPFNFQERNQFRERNRVFSRSRNFDLRYRILGAQILIEPANAAQGSYRLWYTPRFVPLALTTDQPTDILDLEEFIVIDAARRCLLKEESDTSGLERELAVMEKRVMDMAANRDSGPKQIADVRNDVSVDDGFYVR
jgi:hypothetical protein